MMYCVLAPPQNPGKKLAAEELEVVPPAPNPKLPVAVATAAA